MANLKTQMQTEFLPHSLKQTLFPQHVKREANANHLALQPTMIVVEEEEKKGILLVHLKHTNPLMLIKKIVTSHNCLIPLIDR